MDDFIRQNVEKLKEYKKIFNSNTSTEFLTKLCKRGDLQKIESELTKCILSNTSVHDFDERKKFIITFIENYKKISKEHSLSIPNIMTKPIETKKGLGDILNNLGKQEINLPTKINKNTENENNTNLNMNIPSGVQIVDKKKLKKEGEFRMGKKFRPEKLERELPGIANIEIANYSKKYKFLEHHLKHKIEPNIKVCFCMGTKHPIVANCLECGRIQCLQEGEDNCIECKTDLLKTNDFLRRCISDQNLKKCYDHKEKLLKFQKEFYSKMSIIDDYTDWYEISNNTWIPKEMRDLAKDKDDELERIKDDTDFKININLETNEITRVYEEIDDAKVKQEISEFFVNMIRENKNEINIKNNDKGRVKGHKNKSEGKIVFEIKSDDISCAGFTQRASEEYIKFLKERGLGYAKK